MSDTLEITNDSAATLASLLANYEVDPERDATMIADGLVAAFDIVSKVVDYMHGDPLRRRPLELDETATLTAHMGILAAAKVAGIERVLAELSM